MVVKFSKQPPQIVVVAPEHSGRRLDNYLMYYLGTIPKSLIYRIIRSGEVRVNSSRSQAHRRLESGDKVRIPPLDLDRSQPAPLSRARIDRIDRSILFENASLIVLNKPSGMAVHAGTGLRYGIVDIVRALRPECPDIELAHRLDRETSGCLIFAKDRATLRDLHTQLRNGSMDKRYTALFRGSFNGQEFSITDRLWASRDAHGQRQMVVREDGRCAETRVAPRETFAEATLVDIRLLTGRTHQIRTHAQHIGHPVAGDRRYGDPDFNARLKTHGLQRLFLHASRVRFRTGSTAAGDLCIDAPLPADLEGVLARLRLVPESTR